jgi:spoIIIJ-associated protein
VEDGAEYSGRTVEDAISKAESALGTERDELEIEVVSQGSRGVFGIGAESARVRARRRTSTPTSQAAVPQVASEETVADTGPVSATATRDATDVETTRVVTPVDGATLPEEASGVLRQLLQSMGFDADVSVRSRQDPVMLAISGNDLGVLIGRRGDNLAALQFMVNLILSKNRRQWPRIVIDVENYRERREQSLRTLADRIAYRVQRSQRPFTLEAMPAGDRRVIHLALRDRTDIETYSIGEGAARRVVIAPTRTTQVSQSRYESESRY